MIKLTLRTTSRDGKSTTTDEKTIEANISPEAESKLYRLFDDLVTKYPKGIISYKKRKSKKA